MKRYVAIAAAVTLPVVVVAIAVALWGENGASSAGPVPGVEGSGVSTSEKAPPPTATAAMASSSSQSLTESTSPTPSSELKDGRHFGYIESINLETLPGTVAFDLAYLLTGEEANQAAAEDGYPTPVDNDYYIINDNPRPRTLVVPPRRHDSPRRLGALHRAVLGRSGTLPAVVRPRRLPARHVQGKVLALLAHDQGRRRGHDRGAVSALTGRRGDRAHPWPEVSRTAI